jgi:hypothetical protein
VLDAYNEATGLFEAYTTEDVAALKGKVGKEWRATFITLADVLDDYNNGLTGPGYCPSGGFGRSAVGDLESSGPQWGEDIGKQEDIAKQEDIPKQEVQKKNPEKPSR